jgi:hypothetical protein
MNLNHSDLVGQKINNWTVIRFVPIGERKDIQRCWEIQCKCGRIFHKSCAKIRQRLQCRYCTGRQYVGKISGNLFSFIKKSARYRNIPFDIDKEILNDLLIQQDYKCAITGLAIDIADTSYEQNHGKSTASLDRIDNTKGYIKGNVWWLHKKINILKHILPLEELVYFARLIVENFKDLIVSQHIIDKYEGKAHDNR